MTAVRVAHAGSAGIFCARWPIVDLDQTLGDLRAAAERDLLDLLFELRVQPAGLPIWHVVTPEAEPELTLLTLTLPVQPWADPVRHRARRATTPMGASS